MKNNSVTIFLPSYNGEKYIETQVQTILGQKDVSICLLINDDNSKDRTYEIEERLTNKYINIVLTRNDNNSGSAAMNLVKMIEKFNTEYESNYYAFSDQDDYWKENKLKIAIESLKINNCDLYCSDLVLWDGKNIIGKTKKSFKQKKYDYLFQGGSAGCTYVISKILFDKIAFYIKNGINVSPLIFSLDWFIYFFARINKYKVFIDKNSYILYRLHDNNNFGILRLQDFKSITMRRKRIVNDWFKNQLLVFSQFVGDHYPERYIIKTILYGNIIEKIIVLARYGREFRREKLKGFLLLLIILFKK